MKFKVLQIVLSDADIDAVNSSSDPYMVPKYAAHVKSGFDTPTADVVDLYYETVAEIEATDLDQVFFIGNMGPESAVTRFGQMHSISVGDVIVDEAGTRMAVARFGFEAVN